MEITDFGCRLRWKERVLFTVCEFLPCLLPEIVNPPLDWSGNRNGISRPLHLPDSVTPAGHPSYGRWEFYIIPPRPGTMVGDPRALQTSDFLRRKFGYLDENLRIAIAPDYDGASPFTQDSLAVVIIKGRWAYISRVGKVVLTPNVARVGLFDGADLAPAMSVESGKWGYINSEGHFSILPQFDGASSFGSNGLAEISVIAR